MMWRVLLLLYSLLVWPSCGAVSIDPSCASEEMIRVAYQGESGAYSEKSTRELLQNKVIPIGYPSFEACFRAVASRECDYACLPIENSLGGSIHENYDLMFRYDLKIIGEHEFRVKHCLLAKKGVKQKSIKYAISHPQALAQCDNFLRQRGIIPIPTYDTAGSAKMIVEASSELPPMCTPENTAAIASNLAGRTYGLNCLDEDIEDDDDNFTRFLLLSRDGVKKSRSTQGIPFKTSVVFSLPDDEGTLYKALACFALRDIKLSKIESRPTNLSLINFLKFTNPKNKTPNQDDDIPRFRYCFYLDFLDHELDEKNLNALAQLSEQSDFVKVLGTYPQKSQLVGPIKAAMDKQIAFDPIAFQGRKQTSSAPLKIGIIGFGNFGQFLAKRLSQYNTVSCTDQIDKSLEAEKFGVKYFPHHDMNSFLEDQDIVIFAVPMTEFEDIVSSIPPEKLQGKLVVEVCPLNAHPKAVLLKHLGPETDILSSHPMFGPNSHEDPNASLSWAGRALVYERVRIADGKRCNRFLKNFEKARCQMVEMTAEEHDDSVADGEFVAHLMGRLLDSELLPPTPVRSKEYAALCDVAYMASGDSFEAFFSMFTFNKRARGLLNKMRENLAKVEREIEYKRAYSAAVSDLKSKERQKLIAETKLLLQEIVKNDSESQSDAQVESLAEGETPTNREPKSEANTQNRKGKK